MLNRMIVLLLLFSFAFDGLCADNALLQPPEVRSSIGYLIVKKHIVLPPVVDRIFILPQVKLFILEEKADAYCLIYPGKNYSTVCKIPKYAKYTIRMIHYPADKQISFRGGLEVNTMPLSLLKGEEIPIQKKMLKAYIGLIKRNKKRFPFLIPKSINGLTFLNNRIIVSKI